MITFQDFNVYTFNGVVVALEQHWTGKNYTQFIMFKKILSNLSHRMSDIVIENIIINMIMKKVLMIFDHKVRNHTEESFQCVFIYDFSLTSPSVST